jgi:hypothetical protein
MTLEQKLPMAEAEALKEMGINERGKTSNVFR